MPRALLVLPLASARLLARERRAGDFLIAVDGGADVVLDAGFVPDVLVGDLDSVSAPAEAACEEAGVVIDRHPRDKRDLDVVLALAHVPVACDEVIFVGLLGGRVDHHFANLHVLVRAAEAWRAWALDAEAEVHVVTPARAWSAALPIGQTLSVLPWDGAVAGIVYEGLRFPLSGATMHAGDPYGMSNVVVAPRALVSTRQGRLLVFVIAGA